MPFRTYSGATPENVDSTSEGPGNAKKAVDTQEPVPPLSEFEAKLKTKEDEVLDLTVRSPHRLTETATFLTCRNTLEPATISSSRLSEPPAKRST